MSAAVRCGLQHPLAVAHDHQYRHRPFLRFLAFAEIVKQTYMNIAALTGLDSCDQFEDTKLIISEARKVKSSVKAEKLKDRKSIKVGALLTYHKPDDDFKR